MCENFNVFRSQRLFLHIVLYKVGKPRLHFRFFTTPCEDDAEYGKLYQHSYQHDERWGNEPVYSHPEEEVEQYDVEQVVEAVAAGKSEELAPGGTCAEGEVVGEVEVPYETDDVSGCIGYVEVDPQLQHEVDGIMGGCCECTYYAETDELKEPFIPQESL